MKVAPIDGVDVERWCFEELMRLRCAKWLDGYALALEQRGIKGGRGSVRTWEHMGLSTINRPFPFGMVLDEHITGVYDPPKKPPPPPLPPGRGKGSVVRRGLQAEQQEQRSHGAGGGPEALLQRPAWEGGRFQALATAPDVAAGLDGFRGADATAALGEWDRQ